MAAAAPKRVKKPAAAPAKPARAKAVADGDTPDLIGLSRREAVARAQAGGWQVEVSGIGYVSVQEPAPGTPPARERTLELRLTPDTTTASP